MSALLGNITGLLSAGKSANKAAETGSKITYIVLMILAIIFIAIGIGLLGSWNIMSGMILLLVGGGLGFVGYTLMPKSGGEYEEYFGADEPEDFLL